VRCSHRGILVCFVSHHPRSKAGSRHTHADNKNGKYVAEIRNEGASIKSYMDDKLREQIFVLANSMLSNKPGLALR
jgi:hypothetical protein